MSTKPRLVLGSSSPRRLDILKQIHFIPDVVDAADIDETPKPKELPKAYCLRVALEKNQALADRYPNDFIVTGDTTCAVGRRIFGKPDNRQHAEEIIRLLSGRSHDILTAVVVRAPDGRRASRVNHNRVKVKKMSDEEIAGFIASNQWDGFAGGYQFQGLFARYVRAISGSHTGIVGLPAFETAQLLLGLGYKQGEKK